MHSPCQVSSPVTRLKSSPGLCQLGDGSLAYMPPVPVQINTFQSWRNIAHADALIKLAPAAGATLLLLLTLKFGRNPLALPAVLVCIPVSRCPVHASSSSGAC